MIFILAKNPDDALASLVKEIDKFVADHKDEKLAAVLNFTLEPSDEYGEKIKQFAEKSKLKNVAVTLTPDADRFEVDDDADVTVLAYKGKKVTYNHAVKGKLEKKDAAAVLKGARTLLDDESEKKPEKNSQK